MLVRDHFVVFVLVRISISIVWVNRLDIHINRIWLANYFDILHLPLLIRFCAVKQRPCFKSINAQWFKLQITFFINVLRNWTFRLRINKCTKSCKPLETISDKTDRAWLSGMHDSIRRENELFRRPEENPIILADRLEVRLTVQFSMPEQALIISSYRRSCHLCCYTCGQEKWKNY